MPGHTEERRVSRPRLPSLTGAPSVTGLPEAWVYSDSPVVIVWELFLPSCSRRPSGMSSSAYIILYRLHGDDSVVSSSTSRTLSHTHPRFVSSLKIGNMSESLVCP